MKVAYLMNSYPQVSSTFIGREIEGLERAGIEIPRFAFRRWEGALVDPRDIAEAERTDYLLDDGAARLFGGLIVEVLFHPRGLLRALGLWRKLLAARGGPFAGHFVRHAAYLLEAVALRRRLRRTPVAHVHAHFTTNTAAVAMMVRAMGGPSYSFTVHGPDELFDPEGNSLGLKIEHAAFVACISHFCRSQCMIFSPPGTWDRLRIVHCGVRPDFYAGRTDPPGPARAPAGRALFVARLSRMKGGLVLIEAMARVHAMRPEAELVLIGDGDLRPLMEQRVADLGLGKVVRFLGFRSQTEVRDAMASADMLVLPSFAEGVPVVLMEAMASGLPVIASQVAGVSELVKDGVSGFVIPPGDVETLAARMETLFGNPDLRARMGEAGAATVRADFDIDTETAWLSDLVRATATGNPLPAGLRPGSPRVSQSPLASTLRFSVAE
ncbi:glycosyltransferase [Rhodobacter sp. CZR27]|uniref:glycosyltransferase n=1 Tax=Rhodobacter sp. CZR27 TaxID=2033869 RepID=UPI000BBF3133|nr:glycosyltransferase [Rhodobacter sp. CZR27]